MYSYSSAIFMIRSKFHGKCTITQLNDKTEKNIFINDFLECNILTINVQTYRSNLMCKTVVSGLKSRERAGAAWFRKLDVVTF